MRDTIVLNIYHMDGLLVGAIRRARSVGVAELSRRGHGQLFTLPDGTPALDVTEECIVLEGMGAKLYARAGYIITETPDR